MLAPCLSRGHAAGSGDHEGKTGTGKHGFPAEERRHGLRTPYRTPYPTCNGATAKAIPEPSTPKGLYNVPAQGQRRAESASATLGPRPSSQRRTPKGFDNPHSRRAQHRQGQNPLTGPQALAALVVPLPIRAHQRHPRSKRRSVVSLSLRSLCSLCRIIQSAAMGNQFPLPIRQLRVSLAYTTLPMRFGSGFLVSP